MFVCSYPHLIQKSFYLFLIFSQSFFLILSLQENFTVNSTLTNFFLQFSSFCFIRMCSLGYAQYRRPFQKELISYNVCTFKPCVYIIKVNGIASLLLLVQSWMPPCQNIGRIIEKLKFRSIDKCTQKINWYCRYNLLIWRC